VLFKFQRALSINPYHSVLNYEDALVIFILLQLFIPLLFLNYFSRLVLL